MSIILHSTFLILNYKKMAQQQSKRKDKAKKRVVIVESVGQVHIRA